MLTSGASGAFAAFHASNLSKFFFVKRFCVRKNVDGTKMGKSYVYKVSVVHVLKRLELIQENK